jgi:hypothetical protein
MLGPLKFTRLWRTVHYKQFVVSGFSRLNIARTSKHAAFSGQIAWDHHIARTAKVYPPPAGGSLRTYPRARGFNINGRGLPVLWRTHKPRLGEFGGNMDALNDSPKNYVLALRQGVYGFWFLRLARY